MSKYIDYMEPHHFDELPKAIADALVRAYEKYISILTVFECVGKGNDLPDLFDAYKKPSEAKKEAWYNCIRVLNKYNGDNLCVIYAGRQTFSAGFTYKDEDDVTHFIYITKSRTYDIY